MIKLNLQLFALQAANKKDMMVKDDAGISLAAAQAAAAKQAEAAKLAAISNNTSGGGSTVASNKGLGSTAMSTKDGGSGLSPAKAKEVKAATSNTVTTPAVASIPGGKSLISLAYDLPDYSVTPVATPIKPDAKKSDTKTDDTSAGGDDSAWNLTYGKGLGDVLVDLGSVGTPAGGGGGGGTYAPAGVDQNAVDFITSPIQESPEALAAKQYTAELLAKLRGGKTSYSDQLNELINQFLSRGKFSYDPNSDSLFQAQLASAMQSGQKAMQDTMGQAASLTGGYGSSYATSAANQAYNAYVQGAYDNITDYYQMALGQYQMEGQDMLTGITLVADQDAQEWGRLLDEYGANSGWYGTLSDNDYRNRSLLQSAYTDLIKMQNSDYWGNQDMSYKYAALAQDQKQFDSDLGYRYDALAQSQKQYDSDLSYKYAALAQAQKQYDSDLGYKLSALEQDQKQFDSKLAADAEKAAAAKSISGDVANGGYDLDEGIRNAFKQSGADGVYQLLNELYNSDPVTYNFETISKMFKSVTGMDYSQYGSFGTLGAGEISNDKMSALVDVFLKYYEGGGSSTEEARYAIAKAMEQDAKYFDKFSEEAISEIIDMVIKEGNKSRYLTRK